MYVKLLFRVIVGIALLALTPQLLFAAEPADAEPLDQVDPLPSIKSGKPLPDEPEISTRQDGKKTVEEYRMHGELYMIKITPDHGVPYYLYKEDQQSDWVNLGPNPPMAVPKWTLFNF